MSASPGYACSGVHCVTCSDEGVAMTVIRVDERRGLALCADPEGKRHTVEIALLADADVGAHVLVHAGVAIAELATAAA